LITGKTGFTSDAGYCYVCAYENEGRRYIVALLGCGWPNNKNYKWIDTKKLLQYGCGNYKLKTFLYRDIELPKVKVIDGIDGAYYDFGKDGNIDKENVYVKGFVYEGEIKMLLKEGESINIDIHMLESVEALVNKGQLIGNMRYYIGDDYEKIINIYSSEKIEKRDYLWCFGVIFKRFVL
jgi:D-alanyl-D-alanine carboxypeptidase (penicillin-binding protein 5/6)